MFLINCSVSIGGAFRSFTLLLIELVVVLYDIHLNERGMNIVVPVIFFNYPYNENTQFHRFFPSLSSFFFFFFLFAAHFSSMCVFR